MSLFLVSFWSASLSCYRKNSHYQTQRPKLRMKKPTLMRLSQDGKRGLPSQPWHALLSVVGPREKHVDTEMHPLEGACMEGERGGRLTAAAKGRLGGWEGSGWEQEHTERKAERSLEHTE